MRSLSWRFSPFLFFLYLIGSLHPSWALLSVDLSAEAALLMEAATGELLFHKEAHKRCFPASTTKIATALYVLERLTDHLQDRVKVDQDSIVWMSAEAKKRNRYRDPAHWLEPGMTHIALKKGEEWTLLDLLYGMMLPSANDAANVIARYVGGSVAQFMEQLNSYLLEKGCRATQFKNPHGLFHPDHWTTPYDMAQLARHALNNQLFRTIIATTSYRGVPLKGGEPRIFVQGNKLLKRGNSSYYPYAIGIKTGYTSASGHTLVAAAEKEGRRLIAVLMGCRQPGDTFKEAKALFEAAYREPLQQKKVIRAGPQPVTLQLPGAERALSCYCKEPWNYEYYPSQEQSLCCQVAWKELSLPIEPDEEVGVLLVTNSEGQELARRPLFAEAAVRPSSPWLLLSASLLLSLLLLCLAWRKK